MSIIKITIVISAVLIALIAIMRMDFSEPPVRKVTEATIGLLRTSK